MRSIPGVCEVESFPTGAADAAAPVELLVEVPHGATRARDYAALRARLRGSVPERLEEFFFVNTDVGAPECAVEAARRFAAVPPPRSRGALVLRSLIPRTFADCNRCLDAPAELSAGITPAIPGYVGDPRDRRLLGELHATYQEAAAEAYEAVCASGGRALQLHTYAPRTVEIARLDAGIVDALRQAYAPGVYETWALRPPVDLISRAADGRVLAPAGLVAAIRAEYGRSGIEATDSATYRLHPSTTAYRHAERYPDRVVCIEIRRDLLATPFRPFEEMTIGTAEARRMAGPLALALLATMD